MPAPPEGPESEGRAPQRGAEPPQTAGSLLAALEKHLPRLEAFVRARAGRDMLARESAMDLVQSVCREVLADAGRLEYRGESEFAGYLFLQAKRKILDRRRYMERQQRDARREQSMGEDPERLLEGYADLCSPSRQAAAREEVARLEAALAELPERQRVAVAMSRILGMEYGEIARELECSESAARGLVARGLAALAGRLGS